MRLNVIVNVETFLLKSKTRKCLQGVFQVLTLFIWMWGGGNLSHGYLLMTVGDGFSLFLYFFCDLFALRQIYFSDLGKACELQFSTKELSAVRRTQLIAKNTKISSTTHVQLLQWFIGYMVNNNNTRKNCQLTALETARKREQEGDKQKEKESKNFCKIRYFLESYIPK